MSRKPLSRLGFSVTLAALAALYPHWEQNGYYKERPFLFRFYCRLLRRGHFRLASLLAKCRGKN